jgi:hypothetical protein
MAADCGDIVIEDLAAQNVMLSEQLENVSLFLRASIGSGVALQRDNDQLRHDLRRERQQHRDLREDILIRSEAA